MFARPLIWIALCAVALLAGCSSKDPNAAFYKDWMSLPCPAPARGQFAAWGQHGAEHVCIIRHGPFVAYENGFVNVKGQYDMGKESGVWIWYDKDGHESKRIDYSVPEEAKKQ